MYWPEGSWDNYYYLCVCPDCGAVGLTFTGREDHAVHTKSGSDPADGGGPGLAATGAGGVQAAALV